MTLASVHVSFNDPDQFAPDGVMTPARYLEAARCPASLVPREFGLWEIKRVATTDNPLLCLMHGNGPVTLLSRWTDATIHLGAGEVVMNDGRRELRRHLPIWLAARGRVLVTGLGLGCVVRGLLANPDVDRIDVVEIDRKILDVVGAEFAAESRVILHHADAMRFQRQHPALRWDYAWHDIWCEDGDVHLQCLHLRLLEKFNKAAPRQGAWQFPRFAARLWARKRSPLLGAKKKFHVKQQRSPT
jgi:hypothetical protein